MVGASLLARRVPGASSHLQTRVPVRGGMHPVLERYAADLSGRPLGLPGRSGLDESMRIFRRWPNPESVGSGEDDVVYAPGEEMSLPQAEEIPLDALVQNYIDGRRQAYVAQAWERFEQGRYREATDRFDLADSVSVNDPYARAEVKGGLVYSALASRQYALALSSLSWLLTEDPRSGQLPDPDILHRLPVAEDMYGQLRDYDAHLREVTQFVSRNQDSPDSIALRAMLLWFRSDTRSRAQFYAERLKDATPPTVWSRLPVLMQRAAAVDEPSLSAPMLPGQ